MKKNVTIRRWMAALLCACLALGQVGTVRSASAEANVDVAGVTVALGRQTAELTIGGARQEIAVSASNTTSEAVKVRVFISGTIGGATAGVVYPYKGAAEDAYFSTDENVGLPGSSWSMANRMNKYLEFNLQANQSVDFSFWVGAIADHKYSGGTCVASLSYAVYQNQLIGNITGTHTTDAVTLLTGNSYLRGEDLAATIQNYEEAFLLGVAADFCVFLKKDFNVTESDAEGRVAVGGDFIIDTPDWGGDDGRKYTVGAGDFVTHVPLDELLIDRLGAATIVLGGELKSNLNEKGYGRLNDTYYEYEASKKEYAKYEGNREPDGMYENGQLLMTPKRYSPKKLVLNSQNIPSWVYGYGEWDQWVMSLPDPSNDGYTGREYYYPVMDRSQAYAYPLLRFDTQFNFLNEISEKLVNQAGLSQIATNTKIEFEEGYLPDYMNGWPEEITNGYKKGRLRLSYEGHETEQDCVYFTLNEEEFELFQRAQFISFENIPKLPEPRPVIGNDGVMMMWEYAYIIINVNVEGVSGDLAKQGSRSDYDLDSSKKYIFVDTGANFSKITTINHTINISDHTVLVPDDDPDNRLGVKEESIHNNNDEGVTSVLYNFSNTTSNETVIALASNFQGTIFAPNAHVTDEFTLMPNPEDTDRGHLSGALIAESFTGATEFGYRPFSAAAIQIIGTGNLTVTKTVAAAGNDPDQEFTFDITLLEPDGNMIPNGSYPLTVSSVQDPTDAALPNTPDEVQFKNGKAQITLKGGQKATIRDLPLGSAYTVSEVSVAGYETSYKVNNTGVIGENAEGRIVAGDTQHVEAVNTYHAGSLALTKTVEGKGADRTRGFDFTVTVAGASGNYDTTTVSAAGGEPVAGTVTFTDGVATVTVRDGETVTITGLPDGAAYTVTEVGAAGYRSGLVEGSSATGRIDKDEQKTAAFRNTFLTGGILVKKTVTGEGADKTREFSFTVTLGDGSIHGEYGEMDFADGVATFTLKDGETKSATDLPAGITYAVEEETYADYVLTKEGDDAGLIVADTQKTTEFINAKIEETETNRVGDLVVMKQVEGEGADQTKTFNFTVTLGDRTIEGVYGDMTFTNGVAVFALRHGEIRTASGLPAGITYTVTEEVDAAYVPTKTDDTGLIPEDEKVTATFVNRKIEDTGAGDEEDRKEGNLVVTKTVTGEGADQTQAFSFTVRLSQPLTGSYGEMSFVNGVATFTLSHGGVRTATGLPADITYTVTEEDAEHYTASKTGATGVITEDGTATAGFVNTYTAAMDDEETGKHEGSLIVTKTVAGVGADRTKAFRFTVTLGEPLTGSYGSMSFVDGVASFTLAHGEMKSATGLPAGIAYTVKEEDAEHYTASKTGDTGRIIVNGTATAAFVNAYAAAMDDEETGKHEGGLTVSKTVTGEGADKSRAFRFTVTLSQKITQKCGDMSFVNGVATFTLKDGESVSATGLPADITYTVVEDSADGYVTTKTGDTGAIVADQSAKAIFVNAFIEDGAKDDMPKTGDAFPMGVWLGLMMLSLIGVCLAWTSGRRNRQRW